LILSFSFFSFYILNIIATIDTNTTTAKNIPEPIKVSLTKVWSKISGEIFCALASIKYIKMINGKNNKNKALIIKKLLKKLVNFSNKLDPFFHHYY